MAADHKDTDRGRDQIVLTVSTRLLLASDEVQHFDVVEPLPTNTGGLSDGNLNIF